MLDLASLVLHKVLKDKDLDGWARLKTVFFDSSFTSLILAINNYYDKYSDIPSFDELKYSTHRNSNLASSVQILEELDVDESIDLNVAIDALIDLYSQTQTLNLLDKFIDDITLMSSEEIKESLSGLVMELDEKTHTSETVLNMSDITLFNSDENKEYIRFPSGISNVLDAKLGGLYRQEVILLGGKRGAGKSVVCANFINAQYELGNSAVYFTIEMTGKETFNRLMSINAGISHMSLKQDTLSDEDVFKLVKARAAQFEDADDLVLEFAAHKDRIRFETSLIRNKRLKKDNQIIIIDDRELSITAIDLHLQKLKARFGDTLKLAAIDYLNQITVPGVRGNMYDWTTQILVSKKLKELARKHDIAIISPYQIDEGGGTRFAKGILDSCDIAFLLDAHEKEDCAITFDTTKIRGGAPLEFSSPINWETLRIEPTEVDKPSKKEKKRKEDDEPKPATEEPKELPW